MSTRDDILETTCTLLEAQGYHATGLNQILAESGTPKGSLYYYFPQGKEELAAEAVKRAAQIVAQRIKVGLSGIDDPAEAIPVFANNVAHYVEASGFSAGGPLTMVALETVNSSERLNGVCREAYQLLQKAFQEKLVMGGYTEDRAAQLAMFLVAAIEGGILLSRTNHSGDALRQVAEELGRFLKAVPKERNVR